MNPFAVSHTVEISPKAVGRLRQGHLWVYASEVGREPENADPVFVRVVDQAGKGIGFAFYSRQSQIRLRLFSRESEPPTVEALRARVLAAIARRGVHGSGPDGRAGGELSGRPDSVAATLARPVSRRNGAITGSFPESHPRSGNAGAGESSARRLIFGESDLLPGVVVDRYGNCLVLQTLSRGADALKPLLTEILQDALKPMGILERNDVKTRHLEGLSDSCGVLYGEVPDEIVITENGVRFIVDPRNGQKTGFFLDQRENRRDAAKIASGKTLDCFTNSGGFALHFAQSCPSVQAVDISADALRQADRNRELNGFTNIKFHEANVFDCLRELERAGERFDTICLDPPAFAKNRQAVRGARAGYKEINLRALRLLKSEGILITSSCSYHMTEETLLELVCEAARDSRRYIQILERRGQADDHPVLATMPETHYLKCFFIRAL